MFGGDDFSDVVDALASVSRAQSPWKSLLDQYDAAKKRRRKNRNKGGSNKDDDDRVTIETIANEVGTTGLSAEKVG